MFRWVIFLLVACMGCNSSTDQSQSQSNNATLHAAETETVPGDEDAATAASIYDWYRQYTGTIAGQPVVLQLQKYGNNYSGAYYYTSKGQVLYLYYTGTSRDSLQFGEDASTDGSRGDRDIQWKVAVNDKSVTGWWIDKLRGKKHAIRLSQGTVQGSVPLHVIHLEDSAMLNSSQPKYTVFASHQVLTLTPAAQTPHKDFITSTLQQPQGCGPVDTRKCLRRMIDEYVAKYRAEFKNGDSAENVFYTYEQQTRNWVLFNADGWLVIEHFGHDYTGGAHGMYGSNFSNIDVQRGKLWTLKDVIEGDTAKLRPLLEQSARTYFGLKPGESLRSHLLDLDRPNLTNNFYITPKGLAFVYNPYEIASYAQGAITLFIPYEKLYGMLTQEFSARMNKR